jgi:hypothetical protein
MNKHIGTYKFPLQLIAVTPKVLTTLLALLLFGLNPTYGQYNSCYTGADGTTTDEELAERPPLNANCGRASDIYQDFFRYQQSYVPINNQTRPETVTKKIKMRFVILERNNTGVVKSNFRPADEAWLYGMAGWMNDMLADLIAPNNPVTSVCGSCHINDSRFRLELTEIEYRNDMNTYSGIDASVDLQGSKKDSILNIYFFVDSTSSWEPVGYPGEIGFSGGAWTQFGGAQMNPYNSTHMYIGIFNSYLSAIYHPIYDPNIDFSGVLWQASNTLVHEIAHTLGLGHLQEDIIGNWGQDPGGCSGIDYLEDAYPAACRMPYSDNVTRNAMNCMQIRNYLTPLQIGRAHRSAHLGIVSKYIYPVNSVKQNVWNITSNQTWDFAIRMYQDIVVKSGNMLTIRCEVQMPPGSRILVEKGAKLVIDGGIVRAYHRRAKWDGIELVGDKTKGPNLADQGYVELKSGALIEQAWGGIRNFTWDNGAQGGGIIKADSSYFYNCWRGLELNDYPKYATNISVTNCQFLIDDMSAVWGNTPFETQITSWDVLRGIKIHRNKFKILLNQGDYEQHKRRGGVLSSQSGMSIQYNDFDGFGRAVDAYYYSGTAARTMAVFHNKFINNTQSIAVSGGAYCDIRNNDISKMYRFNNNTIFDEEYKGHGIGIMLANTSGAYVGCNNRIDGTAQSDGVYFKPNIGILAHQTASFGATILDNEVRNATVGTQTQRSNYALNITCNDYESNYNAILVNPTSTSNVYNLKNQGTGCISTQKRAGNVFTSNSRDINSPITNTWTYYAFTSSGNISQYPYNTSGSVSVINCSSINPTDENSQCNLWNNCVYALEKENIGGWKSTLSAMNLAGEKYSAEGQSLISNIIHAYNEDDDTPGLIEFLEGEADDNAYRLLIPLYLEVGRYTGIDTPITRMSISSTEKDAYSDYFGILVDLKQSNRKISDLTGPEYDIVATLAAGELEVSGFAKALLQEGYGIRWDQEIEEEPLSPISHKLEPFERKNAMSQLFNAAPNPADGSTIVHTFVNPLDETMHPVLKLTDLTGKVLRSYKLAVGDVDTRLITSELQPGLYLYSLVINGKVKETRKLSVVR